MVQTKERIKYSGRLWSVNDLKKSWRKDGTRLRVKRKEREGSGGKTRTLAEDGTQDTLCHNRLRVGSPELTELIIDEDAAARHSRPVPASV